MAIFITICQMFSRMTSIADIQSYYNGSISLTTLNIKNPIAIEQILANRNKIHAQGCIFARNRKAIQTILLI